MPQLGREDLARLIFDNFFNAGDWDIAFEIADKAITEGWEHVSPEQVVVDRLEYNGLLVLHAAHFPQNYVMDRVNEPSMPVAGDAISNKSHVQIADLGEAGT